jgi:bifunctional DNA-binding transcriptional regulator/antitoxin component of YhaV-PrlF toxin-antitoxin module
MTSWTATVKQDENGDCYIELPAAFLEKSGWKEGDVLEYDVMVGTLFITNTSALERK